MRSFVASLPCFRGGVHYGKNTTNIQPYLRAMPRKEQPLKIHGTVDDALAALMRPVEPKKAKPAKKAARRKPKK